MSSTCISHGGFELTTFSSLLWKWYSDFLKKSRPQIKYQPNQTNTLSPDNKCSISAICLRIYNAAGVYAESDMYNTQNKHPLEESPRGTHTNKSNKD